MMRRDWCRACVTSWWQPNCLLSTFTQTVSHTQRRRTHNDEWHMTMTVTVACVCWLRSQMRVVVAGG